MRTTYLRIYKVMISVQFSIVFIGIHRERSRGSSSLGFCMLIASAAIEAVGKVYDT